MLYELFLKKSCSYIDISRHQTTPRLRGRAVRAQTLHQTRHETGHHRNVADQRTEQHHGFRRSREAGPGIYRELELRKGSEDNILNYYNSVDKVYLFDNYVESRETIIEDILSKHSGRVEGKSGISQFS